MLDKQSDTLPHNERVLVLQDWYHDTSFDSRERMLRQGHKGSRGKRVRCLSCFRVSSALIILVGGDVAQLIEHRTGTPLTQVRFPEAARDILFQTQLSVQTLLRVSVHPRVQSHALTSVRTLKIL